MPVWYRSALVLDIDLDPLLNEFRTTISYDHYNMTGNSMENKWMLDRLPTLPGLP